MNLELMNQELMNLDVESFRCDVGAPCGFSLSLSMARKV
jgi:hypothetical protein